MFDRTSYKDFLNYLQFADLAGKEAQSKLAPEFRDDYDLFQVKVQNPKRAAVAVILFDDGSDLRLLLTRRANYSGHHAKQISFPGGKVATDDASLFDTARRETLEETAVEINQAVFYRALTEHYIPVSRFLVQPFLVYLPYKPKITTNYEVASVLIPKWSEIADAQCVTTREVLTASGKILVSKGFLWQNDFIWGATAMITSELVEMTNRFNDQFYK